MSNFDTALRNAERAVATILRDLEAATKCYVTDVDLQDIDVRSLHDEGDRWARQVRIGVKVPPATNWYQAEE